MMHRWQAKHAGTPAKTGREPSKTARDPSKNSQGPQQNTQGSQQKQAGSPAKTGGSPAKQPGTPAKTAKDPSLENTGFRCLHSVAQTLRDLCTASHLLYCLKAGCHGPPSCKNAITQFHEQNQKTFKTLGKSICPIQIGSFGDLSKEIC